MYILYSAKIDGGMDGLTDSLVDNLYLLYNWREVLMDC